MAIASTMASTPACMETRVPHTTRDSTSRPRSSVPKGWDHEGGLRIWPQSVLSGSAIAIQGAPIASAAKKSTTVAPATAGGRRRARRHPRERALPQPAAAGSASAPETVDASLTPSGLTGRSPEADAGIQERVRYVHEQIDQYVRASRDQDDALNEGVVPREHRLHDQAA